MDDFQEECTVNWSYWVRVALRARMGMKCDDEETGAAVDTDRGGEMRGW